MYQNKKTMYFIICTLIIIPSNIFGAPRPGKGSYNWVDVSTIPKGAVYAGQDAYGRTLYAGRALHKGDLLPAKISPSHGAVVTFGGLEYTKDKYEVLCGGRTAWQFSRKGEILPNAIVVGKTKDGEELYLGRVLHQGSLTPGKVQPSHGGLYIPFDGKEHKFDEYEVLVALN